MRSAGVVVGMLDEFVKKGSSLIHDVFSVQLSGDDNDQLNKFSINKFFNKRWSEDKTVCVV